MMPYLHILGKQIPTYGLTAILGVLLMAGALYLRYRRRYAAYVSGDDAFHVGMMAVVGALIGAKLLYLVTIAPTLIASWHHLTAADWLTIATSGGVFYGGAIGGMIAALLYMRKYKVHIGAMLDLYAPTLPLFHAVARVGCFLAGCCYGVQAHWGIAFAHSVAAPNGVPLVPVQLFESAYNLLLFAGLSLVRAKGAPRGRLMMAYACLYAIGRFVLEFWRGDAVRGVAVLSTSQWISLALLVGCGIALMWTHARAGRGTRAGEAHT